MKNIKDLLQNKKKVQLGELILYDPEAPTIPEIFGADEEIFTLDLNEFAHRLGFSHFSGSNHSKAEVYMEFVKDKKIKLETANDYFMAGFMFSAGVIMTDEAMRHVHDGHEHLDDSVPPDIQDIVRKKLEEARTQIEKQTGKKVIMVQNEGGDPAKDTAMEALQKKHKEKLSN